MVHGKAGLRLEAWKFATYLSIPIVASLTFQTPTVQKFCADYFQFLKYPANPNVNLKEQFEELVQKKQIEKEKMQKYADEVKKMRESAKEKRLLREAALEAENERKRGWFTWLRLRRKQEDINSSLER